MLVNVFPKIFRISVLLAYNANALAANWIVAVVANSTNATLNRKELITVAPFLIGCTLKMNMFKPNLKFPFSTVP